MVHPALVAVGAVAASAVSWVAVSTAAIYATYGTPFEFEPWWHPRRIYLLQLAALDHLTSVRWLREYIRWTRFLRQKPWPDHVWLDVEYGSRYGSKADIYAPAAAVPSPHATEKDKHKDKDEDKHKDKDDAPDDASSENDSHRDTTQTHPTTTKHPVILFVHGGAWGYGTPKIYPLLAHELTMRGFVVVMPDYVKHPRGTIPDMLDDLSSCLVWIEKNISSHGGDISAGITLLGHSSGAHLCTLLTLRDMLGLSNDGSVLTPALQPLTVALRSAAAAAEGCYKSRSQQQQPGSSSSSVVPAASAPSTAAPALSTWLRAWNAIAQTTTRTPLHVKWPMRDKWTDTLTIDRPATRLVTAVVGLCGVYDITDHYLFEAGRGVECVSPMWHVAGACKASMPFVSPTALLKINADARRRAAASSSSRPRNEPRFLLIHGSRDATVPVSSSEKFHAELQQARLSSELHIFNNVGHADLVMNLMAPQVARPLEHSSSSVSSASTPTALRRFRHDRQIQHKDGERLFGLIEDFAHANMRAALHD